jgi:hypothetical protein
MTKPTIKIHNTETNEIIEREMNTAEFSDYETDQSRIAADVAKDEARATQKAALLERLGITEDEARLLLA